MPRPFLRLLFTGLLLVTPAWAQEESVYLDFHGSPDCPSQAEFVAQVKLRTARPRFVTDPQGARAFVVHAEAQGGQFAGRLASGPLGAPGRERTVESEHCSDVISALALIMALAVDPQASTAPLSPAPAPAPPAPGDDSHSTDGSGGTAPAAPSPHPTAPVPRPAPPVPARPAPAQPVAAPQNTMDRVSGNASGSVLGGMQASAAFWFGSRSVPLGALSIFLEWDAGQRRTFAPSLRVSGSYAASPTVFPGEGGAQFTLLAGEIDFCPVQFPLTPKVVLRPCLGASGGMLQAQGVRHGLIVHEEEVQRPWGTLQELIRVQAALGRQAHLVAEAGVAEPIWADKFVFRTPDLTIIQVPRAVPKVGLGLAVRFW